MPSFGEQRRRQVIINCAVNQREERCKGSEWKEAGDLSRRTDLVGDACERMCERRKSRASPSSSSHAFVITMYIRDNRRGDERKNRELDPQLLSSHSLRSFLHRRIDEQSSVSHTSSLSRPASDQPRTTCRRTASTSCQIPAFSLFSRCYGWGSQGAVRCRQLNSCLTRKRPQGVERDKTDRKKGQK